MKGPAFEVQALFFLVLEAGLLYVLFVHLELDGIARDFGEFRLEPVQLKINKGEFFCLLGPSGCGKTTVLRVIGGFEIPDSGRVLLGGRDITKLPPNQRSVHTVFQRFALFPHLSVFENVAFSLRIQKYPNKEIQQRVYEALSLVEINELKHRRIDQISGGQAQRVALARALIGRPDVLLLDEPLSALDPALRVKMREELRQLCRKVGATFIMVTHDQEEALQLSDRLAVMSGGKCLQVGTPQEIYEEPVDRFVAKFIGPVNEIPCEVGAEDTADTLQLSSPLGSFQAKKQGHKVSGRSLQLVLRPEKVKLLRQRSQTQVNQIEGVIHETFYLGNRTEYLVKSKDFTFKVFEPELERVKRKSLNFGDKIFMSWRAEDSILLPTSEMT